MEFWLHLWFCLQMKLLQEAGSRWWFKCLRLSNPDDMCRLRSLLPQPYHCECLRREPLSGGLSICMPLIKENQTVTSSKNCGQRHLGGPRLSKGNSFPERTWLIFSYVSARIVIPRPSAGDGEHTACCLGFLIYLEIYSVINQEAQQWLGRVSRIPWHILSPQLLGLLQIYSWLSFICEVIGVKANWIAFIHQYLPCKWLAVQATCKSLPLKHYFSLW